MSKTNIVPPLHPLEKYAWRSDYKPSRLIRKELQDLRQTYMERMKAIDDVTATLLANLEDLASQRKELEARIKKLDAATAPWKKLPPEMLALIFDYVQAGRIIMLQHSWSHSRVPEEAYPERVCSSWRSIALSIPSLWSAAYIDYAEIFDAPKLVEVLTAHAIKVIARGTRSLCVGLAFIPSELAERCLRSLIEPYSTRLESLEITHFQTNPEFLTSIIALLPSLPALSSFRGTLIENYELENPELLLSPPDAWNKVQITSLALGGLSDVIVLARDFFRILELLPQLNRFECGLGWKSADDLENSPLVHLKLQRLEVEFKRDWPEGTSSILAPLHLPALKRLHLTARGRDITVTSADVISLLNRSRCALLHFHVLHHTLTESDLEALLPRLSSLEGLWMEPTIMTPILLKKIATAELLPELTELRGQVVGNLRSIQAVMDVAESRWSGKNGANIGVLHYGYQKLPDWKPPQLSSEWKAKVEAEKRWIRINQLLS